ncbi:Mu-like prophage protein gp16 [Serratia liquefaciens]|nr:Mu-like prophage protein gp16 [Serratia liquefaciens]
MLAGRAAARPGIPASARVPPQNRPAWTPAKVARSREAILAKIEALLAEAKRPWNYAEGLAAHMYQQHVLEWLTVEQLSAVMKALIIDAKRRKNRSKPS